MGSRILLCALVIFALVFARAKIFAHQRNATSHLTDTIHYPVSIGTAYLSPVATGIDSILASLKLTRDEVEIFGSALVSNSLIQSLNSKKTTAKIAAVNLEEAYRYNRYSSKQGSWAESMDSVIVKGRINFYSRSSPSYPFLFERVSMASHAIDDTAADPNASFWDSTAKPVLVTLGAIAVIALFFLI